MMFQNNMKAFLDQLNIDLKDVKWQDLAACPGLSLALFFEEYEASLAVRRQMDSLCLNCPVQKECFLSAVDSNDTGLRGGFYLTLGKIDKAKNAHKTEEIVKKMARKIYGE